MDDKNNEMITVTVYADDTGLFNEIECYINNTTNLTVPKWVVENWYKEDEISFKGECASKFRIPEEKINFDVWFNDVYTCDDFIGFYDYCIIKGIVPNIDIENDVLSEVYYRDENDNIQIVYEGTYNECRRWCKLYNWKWFKGFELKLIIK